MRKIIIIVLLFLALLPSPLKSEEIQEPAPSPSMLSVFIQLGVIVLNSVPPEVRDCIGMAIGLQASEPGALDRCLKFIPNGNVDLTHAASDAEVARRVCPASTVPVGRYTSSTGDWGSVRGFPCLRFEMSAPQYYTYTYVGSGDSAGGSFIPSAYGDLNGDDTTSVFQLSGEVQNTRLRVAPSLMETSPEE